MESHRFDATRQIIEEHQAEVRHLHRLYLEDLSHIRTSGVVTADQMRMLFDRITSAESELKTADETMDIVSGESGTE